MEVREAGDVTFYRSAQQSTAPCPWRKGTVGFLQAWSFIRHVAKEGPRGKGFPAIYKQAPSPRHRGKRSDRSVSSAHFRRNFLTAAEAIWSQRGSTRGVCRWGQTISALSVSSQAQGPSTRLW